MKMFGSAPAQIEDKMNTIYRIYQAFIAKHTTEGSKFTVQRAMRNQEIDLIKKAFNYIKIRLMTWV